MDDRKWDDVRWYMGRHMLVCFHGTDRYNLHVAGIFRDFGLVTNGCDSSNPDAFGCIIWCATVNTSFIRFNDDRVGVFRIRLGGIFGSNATPNCCQWPAALFFRGVLLHVVLQKAIPSKVQDKEFL